MKKLWQWFRSKLSNPFFTNQQQQQQQQQRGSIVLFNNNNSIYHSTSRHPHCITRRKIFLIFLIIVTAAFIFVQIQNIHKIQNHHTNELYDDNAVVDDSNISNSNNNNIHDNEYNNANNDNTNSHYSGTERTKILDETTTTTKSLVNDTFSTTKNIDHIEFFENDQSQQQHQYQRQRLKLRFDWTNLTKYSSTTTNNNNDETPSIQKISLLPSLDLTRQYIQHQSNCSLPLGDFIFRNEYGLGSDLHFWGRALCNGFATGRRIRTISVGYSNQQNWTWLDQQSCFWNTNNNDNNNIIHRYDNDNDNNDDTTTTSSLLHSSNYNYYSPMLCYFPFSELQCLPQDLEYVEKYPNFQPEMGLSQPNGNIRNNMCQQLMQQQNKSVMEQRMAGLEFLFLHLSPLVVQEAERQLNLVFGTGTGNGNGTTDKNTTRNSSSSPHSIHVPNDLITVHIRWGDKGTEMRLVPIQSYLRAVYDILELRGISKTFAETLYSANIYLATEDPRAVQAFQNIIPSHWNLYLDQFYVEMLPYRIKGYNGNPLMAKQLQGKAGLVTLGSLLVAMEANDFVLTTASNWSRLMNELRLTILKSLLCNTNDGSDNGNNNKSRCTTNMIDLRKPAKGDG